MTSSSLESKVNLLSFHKDKIRDSFDIFRETTPEPIYDWTEKKRLLGSNTPRPGRWNHDVTPYLKEIFDAYNDPECDVIVAMLASQLGKTEFINNCVAHTIDEDPCPALIVFPIDEMAHKYSKIRLHQMFMDMPQLLENFINANHSRKSEGKTLLKVFKKGYLLLSGANSPSNLSS